MQLEIVVERPAGPVRPTPLLFVHGMWHAAWCWQERFLPYFAQHGYVAYAVSLRGHGGSEGHERLRWTALREYVADVLQAAGQIEPSPVLIGHSMGGAVVQKALASYPAPAAVLLASNPPQGLLAATLRFAARHPLVFLRAVLTLHMYPVIGTPRLCREFLFSPDLPDAELDAYFARMQDEAFRAYMDLIFFALSRPRRVRSPLLVLGATNDRAISVGEVEATARAYGTTAEFFPLAHDMMLEPGWQAVADRIMDWLAAHGLA